MDDLKRMEHYFELVSMLLVFPPPMVCVYYMCCGCGGRGTDTGDTTGMDAGVMVKEEWAYAGHEDRGGCGDGCGITAAGGAPASGRGSSGLRESLLESRHAMQTLRMELEEEKRARRRAESQLVGVLEGQDSAGRTNITPISRSRKNGI